jgi:hypothetical protein
MNKICSQGGFDGACFLYSIANAYTALTGKKPTQRNWDKALKNIPFLSDFMTSDMGTKQYDENLALYEFTIKTMLDYFSLGKVKIESYPDMNKVQNIKRLLGKKSVVIVNIKSEHWVVVVDSSDQEFQVACSFELMKKGSKYEEHISKGLKKSFNKTLPIDGKWLHSPSVFKISV